MGIWLVNSVFGVGQGDTLFCIVLACCETVLPRRMSSV